MKALATLFVLIIFLISNLTSQECNPPTASEQLDANNVNATILNAGDDFWNFASAGYEIPKGSGNHSIFSGGLWMGGLDANDDLHLAANTYRQGGANDFFSGPLLSNGTTNHSLCDFFDQVWTVRSIDIDAFIIDLLDGTINNPIPTSILNWPGKGNTTLPLEVVNQTLAPFYDADRDGNYNPQDGDYPILGLCNSDNFYATQMSWYVYNDGAGTHTNTQATPIGLEVQTLAFSFATSDNLNNTTFFNHKLINKRETLDEFYVGRWLDADLGNNNDDFVGCDPSRNLGITYNGDADDEGADGYGTVIPMIGIDFVQGLTGPGVSDSPMSSFISYANSANPTTGNPSTANQYYNYIRGLWRDMDLLTFGGSGTNPNNPVTSFMFPDEPNNTNGWSECTENNTPGDRRFVMNMGPIDLEAGEIYTFTEAILWLPEAAYPCPSFNGIQSLSDEIQALFQNGCLVVGENPLNYNTLKSSLTPNPFRDEAKLTFPDQMQGLKYIQIFNQLGQLVYSIDESLEKSFIVKGSDLGKGIFIYKVISKEGQSVGKFVVQ